MKLIGITGGIGSGKSTIAKMLSEQYDIPVIDADALSHKASEREDVLERIKEVFGDEYVVDGVLQRKDLGREVFRDTHKIEILNSIMHPIIHEEFDEEIARCLYDDVEFIIYDCPLLVEANQVDDVDAVVVVYADEDKRVKRVVERSRISPQEALDRIHSQMPLDEKLEYADVVVYNNGSREDLQEALEFIYKEIEKCL